MGNQMRTVEPPGSTVTTTKKAFAVLLSIGMGIVSTGCVSSLPEDSGTTESWGAGWNGLGRYGPVRGSEDYDESGPIYHPTGTIYNPGR